jgi:hypothetical protein
VDSILGERCPFWGQEAGTLVVRRLVVKEGLAGTEGFKPPQMEPKSGRSLNEGVSDKWQILPLDKPIG